MRSMFAALIVGLAMPAVLAQTSETIFTATSANVAEPGGPVKIRILRWSTPEEAVPLVAALNPPPAPARRGGGPEGAAAAQAEPPGAAHAGGDVVAHRPRR